MDDQEGVSYTSEEHADGEIGLCAACNIESPQEGFPNSLCQKCRQQLINYPIPKWIWMFGIGVLIIMVIAAFRLPAHFSAALHLAKAEKAMKKKLYWTAERELTEVLNVLPDNIIANGRMLISACYNHDMVTGELSYSKILNKDFEDENLLADVEIALSYAYSSIPSDTIFLKKLELAKLRKDSLLKLSIDLEKVGGRDMISGQTVIASALYDLSDYQNCERIAEMVLSFDSTNYGALGLLSAVKRNNGKYSEALALCDKMLTLNKEDVVVLGQKVRIELKAHHDREAAEFANQAMVINPDHLCSLESKAMVDYFAGKKTESMNLLAKIKQREDIEMDSTISRRLEPILTGSKIYR